jgi:hypothetical protein
MAIGLIFLLSESSDPFRTPSSNSLILISSASLLIFLLSLLIWVLGALMLVRASPWNKVHGWKRLLLTSALTSALILLSLGSGTLGFLIADQTEQYGLKGPIHKTVDIVDGECKLDHYGLHVESLVHNSSTSLYKINAIKVRVGSRSIPKDQKQDYDRAEFFAGRLGRDYRIRPASSPTYLKADATETITGTIENDEFLNRMISERELWCMYGLELELPTGNYSKMVPFTVEGARGTH